MAYVWSISWFGKKICIYFISDEAPSCSNKQMAITADLIKCQHIVKKQQKKTISWCLYLKNTGLITLKSTIITQFDVSCADVEKTILTWALSWLVNADEYSTKSVTLMCLPFFHHGCEFLLLIIKSVENKCGCLTKLFHLLHVFMLHT